MNTSKLKIRLATLWVMVESFPRKDNFVSSEDIVQLHKLSHHNYRTNENEPILERFRNQPQKNRRKRKRKGVRVSDSIERSFENHSYNHITKDDDNHIIKSNRKEEKRRKVNSINIESSNNFNSLNDMNSEYLPETNLTLWIFRINNTSKELDRVSDKVSILS